MHHYGGVPAALRVDRSVAKQIRENPGWITIQVQQSSDPEVAATALARAGHEIAELDGGWRSAPNLRPGDSNGPKYISRVLPATTGPFLSIDGGYTPEKVLLTIPDIVVRHLQEAGISSAVVGTPEMGSTLCALHYVPRAAVLLLYPDPSAGAGQQSTIPNEWLAAAAEWLTDRHPPGRDLWAAMAGTVEFPVPASTAVEFLEECSRSRPPTSPLVAANPPTPEPVRKADAEGWKS